MGYSVHHQHMFVADFAFQIPRNTNSPRTTEPRSPTPGSGTIPTAFSVALDVAVTVVVTTFPPVLVCEEPVDVLLLETVIVEVLVADEVEVGLYDVVVKEQSLTRSFASLSSRS